MAENKSKDLPAFASLDELVEFFDTHDMGDYRDAMPEVQMEVGMRKRTHLVALDEEVNVRLTEIAKLRKVPVEALVNEWLKEKISSHRE